MYIIYLKLYQAPLKKSERVLRAVPISPYPHPYIPIPLHPYILTSLHPYITTSLHPYIAIPPPPCILISPHLHISISPHPHIPISPYPHTPFPSSQQRRAVGPSSSHPCPSSIGLPCPSCCGAHVGWWPHGATGAGTDAFPGRFPAKLLLGLLIFTEITCCERRRVYGPLTNRKPRASAGCKS
uniref:Uncharacterized protein n=1 Tax=Gallus gallus TaxID=9031 RepID=A0A8V1AG62_CHICK